MSKPKPLSREYLLNRGTCCNNNCFNCPYKPKKNKMKKHPYYDSDRKQKTESFAMKAIATVMLGLFATYVIATIASLFLIK